MVYTSSASYTEAYGIDQAIDNDDKNLPSVQRYLTRASLLERAAVAATTFSSVQYARVSCTISRKSTYSHSS